MRLEMFEAPSRSHAQIHPPYFNQRTSLSAHPITPAHFIFPHLLSLRLTLCTAPPHTWCGVAAGARRQKVRCVKGCAVSKEWKSESWRIVLGFVANTFHSKRDLELLRLRFWFLFRWSFQDSSPRERAVTVKCDQVQWTSRITHVSFFVSPCNLSLSVSRCTHDGQIT